MKQRTLWTTLFASAWILGSLAACAPYQDEAEETAPDSPQTEYAAEEQQHSEDMPVQAEVAEYQMSDMNQLLRDIRAAAADPRATELASCQLQPIGAKPCGGPEAYILYSAETADVERLETLAQRYTELARIRNERESLVSDCAVLERPQVNLRSGVCTTERTADY